MFAARFAVFARRARVLPSPSQATRNLSFLEVFTGARHVGVSSCCCTGLVHWIGTGWFEFPQNETCAYMYAHVVVVRRHIWRTVCSVCTTGARVAQSFPSNSKFVVSCGFTGADHVVVSSCCCTGLVRVGLKSPTDWNLYKRVRARGGGA